MPHSLANWLGNTTFDKDCTVTYPPWNRTLQSHDAEERWSTPTLLLFNTLLPSSGDNMKCRGLSGKDGGLTFTTAFIFWVYFHTFRSTNFDDSVDCMHTIAVSIRSRCQLLYAATDLAMQRICGLPLALKVSTIRITPFPGNDIHNCCVYSEKLLMVDRGTVGNM